MFANLYCYRIIIHSFDAVWTIKKSDTWHNKKKCSARDMNTLFAMEIIMITSKLLLFCLRLIYTDVIEEKRNEKQSGHGVYGPRTALNHNTNIHQCWPAAFSRVSVRTDWLWLDEPFFLPHFLRAFCFSLFISVDFVCFFFLHSCNQRTRTKCEALPECKVKIVFGLFKGTNSFVVTLDSNTLWMIW